LVKIYPSISRDQVLHTISFCSGYIRHFDEHRKIANSDKILAVMTIEQLRKWNTKHEVAPDMCKRIVPNTALVNVYNPFSGDVV